MRIRLITFDHPTPIAPELLSQIQRECKVQINYIGLTVANDEGTAKQPPFCVYSVECLQDCDYTGAKLIAYLRVLLK